MKPLQINFGCGGNCLPDFHNHDYEVRIENNLPYKDNTVDFVLAEHVAEHVSGPDCLHFFQEIYRILKPGGIFRVCMPVLDRLTRTEARGIISLHGHKTIWNTELIHKVLWVAGFNDGDIKATERSPLDGHHAVIGIALDDKETARFEAKK